MSARPEPNAERLLELVGQRLLNIRVVPLGVLFEFERATYWAYGGPPHPHIEGAKPPEREAQPQNRESLSA